MATRVDVMPNHIIEEGDIVRFADELWRVDYVDEALAELWQTRAQISDVPVQDLEFVGRDTLTGHRRIHDGDFYDDQVMVRSVPRQKEPKKDLITTGSLIKQEVQRLRDDVRPLHTNAPGARKSVLDDDDDTDEPQEPMPKREGRW
jgi:hypothetical protein